VAERDRIEGAWIKDGRPPSTPHPDLSQIVSVVSPSRRCRSFPASGSGATVRPW
jgi:hypothetical protein